MHVIIDEPRWRWATSPAQSLSRTIERLMGEEASIATTRVHAVGQLCWRRYITDTLKARRSEQRGSTTKRFPNVGLTAEIWRAAEVEREARSYDRRLTCNVIASRRLLTSNSSSR